MFENLFPIFCFGVVITGIVAKGMMTAAGVAQREADLEDQKRSLSALSRSAPTAMTVSRQTIGVSLSPIDSCAPRRSTPHSRHGQAI